MWLRLITPLPVVIHPDTSNVLSRNKQEENVNINITAVLVVNVNVVLVLVVVLVFVMQVLLVSVVQRIRDMDD